MLGTGEEKCDASKRQLITRNIIEEPKENAFAFYIIEA